MLATAHDMDREYRMLDALQHTDVPVPRPRLRAGAEIIGAPFYVMDFSDGVVLRERRQLEALAGRVPAALAEALVDVLTRLHRTDFVAVGLADLGRPDGYLERQLRRWAAQFAASRSRDLPELVRLGTRLGRRLPTPQTAAIVHGGTTAWTTSPSIRPMGACSRYSTGRWRRWATRSRISPPRCSGGTASAAWTARSRRCRETCPASRTAR
ncbi:hypothetical protein FRAHR75_610047 [Frankia sp. Hr75.2]|nr:hypothetical protein FRAHR75_610047 [Frankia sp. Hr75.2]